MYRGEILIQKRLLIAVTREETPTPRRHVSLVIILAVYFSHLLCQCNSNGVFSADTTTDNYSMTNNDTELFIRVTGRSGDRLPGIHHQEVLSHTQDTSYQLTSENRSLPATTENTAVSWSDTFPEYPSKIALPANATNNDRLPVVSTTPKPKAYTRRNIYIRGHLLHHPPPAPRKVQAKSESGQYVRDLTSSGDNTEGEPDGATSRRKRKHSSAKARYYNYKMLYDTVKNSGSGKKRTEFYAWIFGAAMLGLGSLTTVSSCFVFCFCSDKVRKRREARTRRGNDKAGEYQRVESVSSIVDHAGEHAEMYDEQMDSVTII